MAVKMKYARPLTAKELMRASVIVPFNRLETTRFRKNVVVVRSGNRTTEPQYGVKQIAPSKKKPSYFAFKPSGKFSIVGAAELIRHVISDRNPSRSASAD